MPSTYYLLANVPLKCRGAVPASPPALATVSSSTWTPIVVPLPPLEEQRAIARVLGALDDRIELNRRMSETLEEMARALFRSWFVDFDPVRAKAEGRPSGLPPDLDALFPASFEASELGEIPAGWEVKALGGPCIDVQHPRARSVSGLRGGRTLLAMPKPSRLSEPILASTRGTWTNAGVARIRCPAVALGERSWHVPSPDRISRSHGRRRWASTRFRGATKA